MLNFKYNMTNIIPLFTIVFILLAISSPFYFLTLSQIINRLKNNYPQKYEELGKPSLFLNNSMQNGMNLIRFLFVTDGLNDPALSRQKNIAKSLLIINLLIFIPFFIYINLSILLQF